jgi:cyclic pyranopterin phosphate synthase
MGTTRPRDLHARPLRSLRLSVTDRCNLRCAYCMPDEEYTWLPKEGILSFAELDRIAAAFVSAGVDKLRLTGGEPLLRRDLHVLVEMLAARKGITDLAMTTNGILLADHAARLASAGLHRITISLDTLREDRFLALTRRDSLPRVLAGIDAAHDAGFRGPRALKLDTVALKGVNDDEIGDLLAFAFERDAELRFIEYMDVPGAIGWNWERVLAQDEILAHVAARFGAITPLVPKDETEIAAPARRFALEDGRTFGIIASTTRPFCSDCDRARLTADGTLYLCLYARFGLDLKTPLRRGDDEAALAARIATAWRGRDDRGAERRLALESRDGGAFVAEHGEDPRLEMHTRGG